MASAAGGAEEEEEEEEEEGEGGAVKADLNVSASLRVTSTSTRFKCC